MNKIIWLFTSIILLSGLAAFASVESMDDPFAGLANGRYTCNKEGSSASCSLIKIEHGFSSSCSNFTTEELVSAIKSGTCTYEPANEYVCQYPEGSCEVIMNGDSNNMTMCKGSTPDISIVEQDAKNGKCTKK